MTRYGPACQANSLPAVKIFWRNAGKQLGTLDFIADCVA
jgi:hypothetical protein